MWLAQFSESRTGVAALLDRLVVETIPNERGVHAWQSLLRAHATLMRKLTTDLVEEVGLTLAISTSWVNLGKLVGSSG